MILGGGSVRDGAESNGRERLRAATLQRVHEGARVARVTGLPILVSGGVPLGQALSEAHLMREALQRDFRLPVQWLEDRSRDTADNAAMSARILHAQGVRRVIVVTHAVHMPRARRAFQAAGFQVTEAPHDFIGRAPVDWRWRDFIPDAHEAARIQRCIHEGFGMLWYGLRGYL